VPSISTGTIKSALLMGYQNNSVIVNQSYDEIKNKTHFE
jgi:hypothetical protein